MKLMVVCSQGFSPEYSGGSGVYVNGIYKYIPYTKYLKVPAMPAPSKGLYPFFNLLHHFKIRKYIAKELQHESSAYEIIHNANVVPFPEIKKTRVVTTVHHVSLGWKPGIKTRISAPMDFRMEKSMIDNSDYIIAVSDFTKERILHYFSFPEERIRVISNGTDTDVFYPRVLSEERFILFPNVLRYPYRKGTYFILPILRKLMGLYDLKCIITGKSSPEGKRIIDDASNKFRYAGFVNTEELARLYSQAMYVIFPSMYEGFGLIPAEVMASGGAIVSSDVGSVSEYCRSGTNGFVLPHNREKWVEVMKELIENSDLREHIRKNNRKEKVRSLNL
ncbi:MAG: glycosyltransferase family 4 protein [Dehalococcoidia bacterium]|nr:glycosyltransferase family 4 protein [Dehalococcoidia bacterium]